MLLIFVNKHNNNKTKKEKMSLSSTNNYNLETTTLDSVKRENSKYISKFEFSISIAQYMDLCLIFYDIQINDPSTASDVEFNSWVLNCLESYQLCSTLVIHIMLEVFKEEFQG